jgi:hypothetical protein
MLWSEPAGVTHGERADDDLWSNSISVGKYGEQVYTQIRRFVVVKVPRKKHFVYAWLVPTLLCYTSCTDTISPISTYSSRGTAKPGVDPKEHAIVYMSGTLPTYLPGESSSSMREPIEVVPTNGRETLDRASRLRFGKTFPIEWNVKVKDVGRIAPSHMSKLIQYWKEESMIPDLDSDNEESHITYPSTEGKQSGQSLTIMFTDRD